MKGSKSLKEKMITIIIIGGIIGGFMNLPIAQNLLESATGFWSKHPYITMYIVAIILIGIFMIWRLRRVNLRLDQIIDNMNNNNYESDSFLKGMKEEYEELLAKSKDKINTQSFIEAYFSKKIDGIIKWIKIIDKSVSVLILLGVLGTFIGLTFSLSNIDLNILSQDMTKGINKLSKLLEGMKIAFYTSIAGMITSVIVNVVNRIWNPEQKMISIMTRLEDYLDNNIRGQIDRQTRQVEAVTELSNKIEQSFSSLENVLTDTFIESIGTLDNTMQNIYNSMNKFNELSNEFEEAKGYMVEFNQGLEESVNKFAELYQTNKELTTIFTEGVDDLKGEFSALGEDLAKLSEERRLIKKETDLLEDILASMEEYSSQIQEQITTLTTIDNRQQNLINTYQSIEDSFEQVSANLIDYSEVSTSQSELVTSFRDALGEMKSDLAKYEERQKDMLAREEEIRELNVSLRRSVDSMTESFGDNMSTNITKLETAIDRLHQEFNSNLQSNLEDLIGEFSSYIKQTNEIIKNKFSDMDSLLSNVVQSVDFNSQDLTDSLNKISKASNSLDDSANILIEEVSKIDTNLENNQKLYSQLNEKVEEISEEYNELVNEQREIDQLIKDISVKKGE
ncbi:hypothetical protein JCM16358_25440 [Halanaerocella petrolearia]